MSAFPTRPDEGNATIHKPSISKMMRQRPFQYSLSWLLLGTTFFAVVLSRYQTNQALRERVQKDRRERSNQAIEKILSMNGEVVYEFDARGVAAGIKVFIGPRWTGGDETLRELASLQNLRGVSFRESGFRWIRLGLATLVDRPEPVRSPGITDRGVALLYAASEVEELDLRSTLLTDRGLAGIGRLRNLRILTLAGTGISGDGMKLLRRLDRLEFLDVSNTAIDDRGVEAIASLPALTCLHVSGTRVTDQSEHCLKQLASLRSLDLSDTPVSEACVERITKALPRCGVCGSRTSKGCSRPIRARTGKRWGMENVTGTELGRYTPIRQDVICAEKIGGPVAGRRPRWPSEEN